MRWQTVGIVAWGSSAADRSRASACAPRSGRQAIVGRASSPLAPAIIVFVNILLFPNMFNIILIVLLLLFGMWAHSVVRPPSPVPIAASGRSLDQKGKHAL